MILPEKVVLIGPAHPLRGGLATFNERLIREYRSMGADASIYTFSLQYPSFLFPGKTQYSSEPPPENIPIYIKVNSVNPFNWLRVGMELKRERPDLVVVKFWMPFMAPCFGFICRILRRNLHTRIVSVIDNIIPHEKRPGDTQLAKFWINSCDGFVAMSHSVYRELEQFDSVRPKEYCPHPLYDNFGESVGREEAILRLGLDTAFQYILFFGFIREYKGLDLLLKAFSDDRLKNMPVRLLVAGEFYTDPKPYLDLIRDSGLEERVVMHSDFIPDSQVLNYFCASNLVVQPYKSATQSGITQIAYHFNKPMIITDVGGLAEFVPHEKVGFVVEPEPSALAGAICRFFQENREKEFSTNAGIEKQKYSWRNMVGAINRVAGFCSTFDA